MNYNETCFYGIDFKKMKLYCKVHFVAAISTRDLYRKQRNVYPIIDSSKFYEVLKIDFEQELLSICTICSKTETMVSIILSFNHVEFSYFFEDTKEHELNELNF